MMLSDSRFQSNRGAFPDAIHLPKTARYELFGFVVGELPKWRDNPNRPATDSETDLTSGLCAHLSTAARFSVAWTRIQFLPEEPDEVKRGRKIDVSPKPLGTIYIEGRRFTEFDKLFPIECKRLPMPAPNDKKRDEREYVVNANGSTGGIQRFKEGNHGAAHDFAGMIGYVQDATGFREWFERINRWITELVEQTGNGWSADDQLSQLTEDKESRTCQCRSKHERAGRNPIELWHAWVNLG